MRRDGGIATFFRGEAHYGFGRHAGSGVVREWVIDDVLGIHGCYFYVGVGTGRRRPILELGYATTPLWTGRNYKANMSGVY